MMCWTMKQTISVTNKIAVTDQPRRCSSRMYDLSSSTVTDIRRRGLFFQSFRQLDRDILRFRGQPIALPTQSQRRHARTQRGDLIVPRQANGEEPCREGVGLSR